ncbi:hypothetical protein ACEXQE_04220 [Herbiconiux sp. P17]|uniref:hypothetical protein n=1 Tax=Herbiconiux wuyangfengii TaxID=3342794 RepID=UPI0035B912E7
MRTVRPPLRRKRHRRVRLAFATLLVLAVPGIALLPPVAALASLAGLLLVVLAVDRMRLAPRPV